jgi:8-oxo-dGTP diphosphatase
MSEDPSDFREAHLRRADFLGAFGLLRSEGRILMVQNLRVVGGREVATWDLPGGQVEPGELLDEALRRELREETGIEVLGPAPFLFFQEGEKVQQGTRRYVWRSFFFAVGSYRGVPEARGEIRAVRWFAPDEVEAVLDAPYHDSFCAWLRNGGSSFRSVWTE